MRKIVFLLIIAGLALIAGVPRPLEIAHVFSSDISVEQRIFYQAENLCRQGRAEEAMPDLHRVLRLNPGHGGALFFAGDYELQKGNTEKARELFATAARDPEYGRQARQRLADMTLDRSRREELTAVKAYLEGGAFEQALKEGQLGLNRAPEDPELLFYTAFAAIILENRPAAEAALSVLEKDDKQTSEASNLRYLLDGWLARESDPDTSLANLLAMKDQRLATPSIRREISRLLLKTCRFEQFEEYMLGEMARNKRDENQISLDLARFYLDQGLFEKGRALLDQRPIESMPDNILFLELLSLSAQEERAMQLSQTLLATWPDDQKIHKAFMNAFLHANDRLKSLPAGKTPNGKTYAELASAEVSRLILMNSDSVTDLESLFLATRLSLILDNKSDLPALIRLTRNLTLNETVYAESLVLATQLTEKGFVNEAQGLLEKAHAFNPDDASVRIMLGENYCRALRHKDALQMLSKVSPRGIHNYPAFRTLVESLAGAGRPDLSHQYVLERLADPGLSELLIQPLKTLAFKYVDMQPTVEAGTPLEITYQPAPAGKITPTVNEIPRMDIKPAPQSKTVSLSMTPTNEEMARWRAATKLANVIQITENPIPATLVKSKRKKGKTPVQASRH